ncbi:hypothetical protein HDU97_001596 [Phlyctochytrium planicorne]|nr:hypothetical protein HDU97_001596 [Phlyctochytrium planicorne]
MFIPSPAAAKSAPHQFPHHEIIERASSKPTAPSRKHRKFTYANGRKRSNVGKSHATTQFLLKVTPTQSVKRKANRDDEIPFVLLFNGKSSSQSRQQHDERENDDGSTAENGQGERMEGRFRPWPIPAHLGPECSAKTNKEGNLLKEGFLLITPTPYRPHPKSSEQPSYIETLTNLLSESRSKIRELEERLNARVRSMGTMTRDEDWREPTPPPPPLLPQELEEDNGPKEIMYTSFSDDEEDPDPWGWRQRDSNWWSSGRIPIQPPPPPSTPKPDATEDEIRRSRIPKVVEMTVPTFMVKPRAAKPTNARIRQFDRERGVASIVVIPTHGKQEPRPPAVPPPLPMTHSSHPGVYVNKAMETKTLIDKSDDPQEGVTWEINVTEDEIRKRVEQRFLKDERVVGGGGVPFHPRWRGYLGRVSAERVVPLLRVEKKDEVSDEGRHMEASEVEKRKDRWGSIGLCRESSMSLSEFSLSVHDSELHSNSVGEVSH